MLGVVIAANKRRGLVLVEVNGSACTLLTECSEPPPAGSVVEGLLSGPGVETLRNINSGVLFQARVQVTNLPKKKALLQLVGAEAVS